MKKITGISEIITQFDNYIIDLWGVLHDGHDPYKGAINALQKLKENGKKIILLSNAPRRAVKAQAVLESLGFSRDMYHLLLTSGEITFNYVKSHPELGKKYFYIGPDKDLHLLDGIGLTQVHSAKEADFAVATGFEGFGSPFSEKQHQLDEALAAKLTLLVANPDRLVVKQTGEEQICSGLMGDYYTQKGGKTIYFGKPHNNAYQLCLEFFGTKDTSRTLCIGDSLHTDVAGANLIGAGSLFITGGIHKRDVMNSGDIDAEKLKALTEKEKQTPTFYSDEFRF